MSTTSAILPAVATPAADSSVSTASVTAASLSRIALLFGAGGITVAILGLFLDPVRGGQSWLLGYSFWFAILIGCLFLIQISYIFDAGWSTIIRRQWEHAISAFPLMFLLLLPVVVIPWILSLTAGTEPLWRWMNTDFILPGHHPMRVGDDVLYLAKAGYLNNGFFFLRLIAYFTVFSGLAFLFRYFSIENDDFPWRGNYRGARKTAAVGVVLSALAMTFAAFDLYMSLTYHWFSTMYGVWFFAGSMRVALAFTVILCFVMGTKGSLRGVIKEGHYYFLGMMSLAFTIFWAYIAFCQYYLIYNANIPEETFWYNMRMLSADGSANSWWYVGLTLIFGYFLIPFLILLWHRTKVVPWRLVAISVWILVFSIFDYAYNIIPREMAVGGDLHHTETTPFSITLFDLAALIGVGGFVMWATLRSIARHRCIPIKDPRIAESLNCSA